MSDTVETIFVVVVTYDWDDGGSRASATRAFRDRTAAENFVRGREQAHLGERVTYEINAADLHS